MQVFLLKMHYRKLFHANEKTLNSHFNFICSAVCFAEIEGAFGIKLGEDNTYKNLDGSAIKSLYYDELITYLVKPPDENELFDNYIVEVGQATNKIRIILANKQLFEITECLKERDLIINVLKEKYNVEFILEESADKKIESETKLSANKSGITLTVTCWQNPKTGYGDNNNKVYISISYKDNIGLDEEFSEIHKKKTEKYKEHL